MAATSTETVHGVCNLCEASCGVLLTVERRPSVQGGDQVTGIRGNPDDPLSRGHICPKGTALADIHADPDWVLAEVERLGDRLSPLSRREALKHLGHLRPDV